MGLLQRLVGGPGPSQEDLQRQADEEIKQMLSQSSGPPADDMPRDMPSEEAASSEASSAK